MFASFQRSGSSVQTYSHKSKPTWTNSLLIDFTLLTIWLLLINGGVWWHCCFAYAVCWCRSIICNHLIIIIITCINDALRSQLCYVNYNFIWLLLRFCQLINSVQFIHLTYADYSSVRCYALCTHLIYFNQSCASIWVMSLVTCSGCASPNSVQLLVHLNLYV